MIAEFIQYTKEFVSFNTWMSIGLYWLPMALALVYSVWSFIEEYACDMKNRNDKYYTPSLTVGTILGRLVLSVLPYFNIPYAVFRAFPKLFESMATIIEGICNIPLVPPKKEKPNTDKQY